MLARTPLVLLTQNSMPVKTVPEFVSYARQKDKDGKPLSYGRRASALLFTSRRSISNRLHKFQWSMCPTKAARPRWPTCSAGTCRL
jgi:hypothetical protein